MNSLLNFKCDRIVMLFCSALFLISCKSGAPLPEYYVSNDGNDNNPGTKTKPFKTIEKINSLKLNPGDKILLRGGDEFVGTLKLVLNGKQDKPITVSSYGDSTATVNGGNLQAIIIKGDYFELSNINAKGNGRKEGNTTNGIEISESSNAYIQDIVTQGFQKSGLLVFDSKLIQLRDITAVNNGFSGIFVSGATDKRSSYINIRRCHAENNPGDPTQLDNHSGNGILVAYSDAVLIEHCVATNNGWDMPRTGNGPVGIWAYESNGVTIQYCISYKNRTSKGGKDGGGFDFDGGIVNSTIQYCLSYDNEGAGIGLFQYAGASLWYNNTIRYNISVNDARTTEGSGGIFVWNGANDSTQLADCYIYNNLVISTYAPAVQFEPMSLNKNFGFYNNIFIGRGEIIHGVSSGEKFLGNVWWKDSNEITFRGHKNMLTWANLTGQEKLQGKVVGRQIDPMLMYPSFRISLTKPFALETLFEYYLKPQSPIRDQGLDLKSLFKIQYPPKDFFGNPIPKGKGIEPGVYEIQE